MSDAQPVVLGLRTAAYIVSDLPAARTWYTDFLNIEPYFDEPFYVGFNVAGYELGLMPAEPDSGLVPGAGGLRVYWGVDRLEHALARAVERGATIREPIQDVGGGVRVAGVDDPFGNVLGLIENPAFRLE